MITTLAGLLVLAMVSIVFVLLTALQREATQSLSEKSERILFEIVEQFDSQAPSVGSRPAEQFVQWMSAFSSGAQFDWVGLADLNGKIIWSQGSSKPESDETEKFIRRVRNSQDPQVELTGETWGVFWKRKKNVMAAAPLSDGTVVAIAISLEDTYRILRNTQDFLALYFVINSVVLTFIGFYRLSSIFLKPVNRLAQRADSIQAEESPFFLTEKGDNEFSRLSKSLNRMFQTISEDREKLRQSILNLEKVNLELKAAQREIIQAEKLASVGRLSSGIAHEIGNPIAIVVGYLDLLKNPEIPDTEKAEYIARAISEIQRIRLVIRQLLDFSRNSSGSPIPVSVHSIVEDLYEVFRMQPLISGLVPKLELEADRDIVLADPNGIRQVLFNMVLNAKDAISASANPGEGELKIRSECITDTEGDGDIRGSERICLSIADNGVGMSSEQLDTIFDPFFTTKEPGKGTGLGLSVSYMIVERLGGTIDVTSEVGKGTIFRICLPIYSPTKSSGDDPDEIV